MSDSRVVVIGGGNAGLSVAGRLKRAGIRDVVVIEPRETHVFAPLQSHIAGGAALAADAVRPQGEVTPRGVEWIRDAAVDIRPDAREVVLASGATVAYDQLVVCPGIQMNWSAVPGLAEAMQTPAGVSNYDHALAVKASPLLRDLREGTVVFVQAADTTSCPGAAQKPMYLACAWWRAVGVLDRIRVVLVTPEPTPHGIPAIDAELQRKIDEYGIEVRSGTHLLSVEPSARMVTIGRGDVTETLSYDVLHAAPRAPAERPRLARRDAPGRPGVGGRLAAGGSGDAAAPRPPRRVGARRCRRHRLVPLRRRAATPGHGARAQSPRRRAGPGAAGALRRILGLPLHREPAHGRVRRVRPRRPARPHRPVLADPVPRTSSVVDRRPSRTPVGVLAHDPQRTSLI
ncbi:FAD-dependent oxidoreductase [Microbacterium lushaniae]|uniref:FAD-dependent oxidoreductase n=1 Tax=Microbacterium lushaniae TaxID=2614639 RepID=UPI0030840D1D